MSHRQPRASLSTLLVFALVATMALTATVTPAAALYGDAEIDPVESDLAARSQASIEASSGQETAAAAIDQDPDTAWVAGIQEAGEQVTLDLGGSYDNVRKLHVVFPDPGATYRYLVEASPDASSWTTVADRADNSVPGRGNTELMTQPDTRYLRVTITGTSADATVGISQLSAFNYLRDDLILGADLSWADDNMHWGGQYHLDPDDPNDPGPHVLDVMQDRGAEYIRLRIFNEPREEDESGSLVDPPFQGPQRSLQTAQWVKGERGMGLGIDFHYADSWADPSKQPKPRAWAELPFEELVDEVYDFTYDYLQQLIDQGTTPEKVAVGNEIINGFMYGSEAEHIGTTDPPYFTEQADIYQSQPGGGLIWDFWGSDDPIEQQLYDEAWDRFTTLSASGIRAVRDVAMDNGTDIEVETHVIIDDGRVDKTLEFWNQYLTRVNDKGEDIDVIAHSYYPEWHGTPDHFEDNLTQIAAAHPGYELDIAETSYPAGVWEGDDRVDGPPLPKSPYPQTVQGQADAIKRVFQIANDLPDNRGVGVLVWEPSEWDTMFSFARDWPTVEANASIDVFNASRATHVLEDAVHRAANVGDPVELPDTVQVLTTADGSLEDVEVAWGEPDGTTDAEGVLTVPGETEYGEVTATVDVVEAPDEPVEKCVTFDREMMGWDWNDDVAVEQGGITVTNPAGTHDDWVWDFTDAPLIVESVTVFSNGSTQSASTEPGTLTGQWGSNLQWVEVCTAGPAPTPPSIEIRDGDLDLVPGDFGVLRLDVAGDAELTSADWEVDGNDVVTLDATTGRIDAIGTGETTVTGTATFDTGAVLTASAQVTVAGGPTPIVEPVAALQDGARPDFIMGADVSSLWQIMAAGKGYRDLDGQRAHLFDILSEQGVNWVRLRVWNDPSDPFGNPYGGGNSTIDTTIELAEQAKARGMKLNVVFHYSDFWAHPGQQRRPAAWQDLTGQALVDALYGFTEESLLAMRDAGVYPDMVTVGNETNSNIVDQSLQLSSQGDIDQTALGVFRAGSAAVRATDPNDADPEARTLVSFHLANADNTSLYENFTLAMANNDVDYDALGASYYPSWHGTYDQVLDNLDNISATHGIHTYIAETAYPWTIRQDAGDDTPQNFLHGDVSTVGLAASVQGQATALREVIDLAANVDDEMGLGVFYWEPAWLPGPANGWATPYGTGWEVAGLFDVNGHALPSVETFSLVRGDQDVPAAADDWARGWETTVTVDQGDSLSMPSTVLAVRNDGRMGDTPRSLTRQPVTWNADDVAAVDVNTPGEYVVFGSIAGIPDNAFAHVVVRASSSASAEAPVFSLPDGAEIAAADDGLSHSARHLVDGREYLELTTETPNARIDLTLDGADPRDGDGSTRELAGDPWVRPHDSIRIYAGPIQIAQNVEVRTVARRTGYDYVSGSWGSDVTILGDSPVVSRSYRAVHDYDDHLLVEGGFESGDLSGWELTGDASDAGVIEPDDFVTYAYAGNNSFAFTVEDGESLTLEQSVHVPNGTYSLTLYARGDHQSDDATEMAISATSGGQTFASEVRTIDVPSGRTIWRQYSIDDIEVTDNTLTVAFNAATTDSYTGYLDHVVLTPA